MPEDHASESQRRPLVVEIAELAGGLAHELRNPLSTMMISLKLLAEDLQDTEARWEDVRRRALLKVDTLRREAERLQSLFDDFLNLTGPCRLQRLPTDLNAITARLAEFFEPLTHSQNIELEVHGTSRPLICPVDEKLLSQALMNIVLNAQEAMPEGGRLGLIASREDEWAVIAVSDTGLGIAPEDRERIFRPFHSTKGSGTGLGLSMTKRIIDEHGGTLTFESEPNKGTTFTIRLPLRPKQVDDDPQG